jgi:hypothetical protein
MAKQDINIGVEGNDGTGDSIRESFRKTNENFNELYAIVGEGGEISLTDLSGIAIDSFENFPSTDSNPVLAGINNDTQGSQLEFFRLVSDSFVDPNLDDSIEFDVSRVDNDGRPVIVVKNKKAALSSDPNPTLNANLNLAGRIAFNTAPSAQWKQLAEDITGDYTEDDVLINKGFADATYLKATGSGTGSQLRVRTEDEINVSDYQYVIAGYDSAGRLIINDRYENGVLIASEGHGLDTAANGAPFVYETSATSAVDTSVTPSRTLSDTAEFPESKFYIRVTGSDTLSLHLTEDAAKNGTSPLNAAGGSGVQTITDYYYQPETLSGKFLANEAIPRESAIRRQGDQMDGTLYLDDHPGELAGIGAPNGLEDLQAATKFYVDNTSFASNINLFVSTSGDDTQASTPPGKEGRSLAYAYRSVNAAARKAEEIVIASRVEPGPYMQKIEYGIDDQGLQPSKVYSAEFDQALKADYGAQTEKFNLLINENIDFVIAETIAYVADKIATANANINLTPDDADYIWKNFAYNEETCARDLRLIINAIRLDTLSGTSANKLTATSGIRYYSNASGRFAVTGQLQQTVATINYAESILLNNILTNDAVPNVKNTDYVQFFDVGLVDAPQAAIDRAGSLFDTLVNIMTNGLSAYESISINDGAPYVLKITNGGNDSVWQGKLNNTDLIPGKVVTGTRSGAIGRIVSYDRDQNDGTNTDVLELLLEEPVEFLVEGAGRDIQNTEVANALGDDLEFGNRVSEKQITIKVESGIYYEDYPIKVSSQVSVVGDEMRRAIIRPRNRVSQSKWANTYFYRDKYFDGLTTHNNTVTFQNEAILNLTGGTITAFKGDKVTQTNTFSYDEAKCRRDLDYIITQAGFDIALGTNYNAVVQGLAYQRASGSVVQNSQLQQELASVGFAGNLVSRLDDVADSPTARERSDAYFAEVLDIIENGNQDTDDAADSLIFPSPDGVDSNREAARDKLQANRAFIQKDVVSHITNNYAAPVGWDSDLLDLHVGFWVDALTYDILYGGNDAITTQARLYFTGGSPTGGTINISAAQQDVVVEAVNRINVIIERIVTGTTIPVGEYATGNNLTQDTSGANASSSEASEVVTNITIVKTAVDNQTDAGLGSPTLPSVTWTSQALQDAKDDIDQNLLSADTAVNIIDRTIEFIDSNTGVRATILEDVTNSTTLQVRYDDGYNPAGADVSPSSNFNNVDPIILNGSEIAGLLVQSQDSTRTIDFDMGWHYANNSTKPIKTFSENSINNLGLRDKAAEILRQNKINIQDEVYDWMDDQATAAQSAGFGTWAQVTIETTNPVTFVKGETVTQKVSGVSGVVKETPTTSGSSTTFILVSPTGEFNLVNELEGSVSGDQGAASIPSTLTVGKFTFTTKCYRDLGYIVDALVFDLVAGRNDQSMEVQGKYYYGAVETGQEELTVAAISHIKNIAEDLLNVSAPTAPAGSTLNWKLDYPAAESESSARVTELIDTIVFAFDPEYNPPKHNRDMDVFLMNDATIIRNMTVQGHGGFMTVLDPAGQILTKSPYIQTGSSFSQSVNKQAFRGGMFVDGFNGNMPIEIVETKNGDPFRLYAKSKRSQVEQGGIGVGHGLFVRKPELPAPFYVNGVRYQVNAIANYNRDSGTAELILDKNSGTKDGNDNGEGWLGPVTGYTLQNGVRTPVFGQADNYPTILQTAGNRSQLGNDFTQINDLGYGLLVTNTGLSEMVGMFTYYCHAAYYANNGSEIRSVGGSNAYGNFGLVAAGSDPNEVAQTGALAYNTVQTAKVYRNDTGQFYAAEEQNYVYVYDTDFIPLPEGEIDITFTEKKTISGFTAPNILTITGHGYTEGQKIAVAGANNQITGLNDDHYVIVTDANTVKLFSDEGLTSARSLSGTLGGTPVSFPADDEGTDIRKYEVVNVIPAYIEDGVPAVNQITLTLNSAITAYYGDTITQGSVTGQVVIPQRTTDVDGNVVGGTTLVVTRADGAGNFNTTDPITITNNYSGETTTALADNVIPSNVTADNIDDTSNLPLEGPNGAVWKLTFSNQTTDNTSATGGLLRELEGGESVVIRQRAKLMLDGVTTVPIRPSTAVVFNESSKVYRSLNFDTATITNWNSTADAELPDGFNILTFDNNYNYILATVNYNTYEAQVKLTLNSNVTVTKGDVISQGSASGVATQDAANSSVIYIKDWNGTSFTTSGVISIDGVASAATPTDVQEFSNTKTFGATAGDTLISLTAPIVAEDTLNRLRNGDMIFGWKDRLHKVVAYHDGEGNSYGTPAGSSLQTGFGYLEIDPNPISGTDKNNLTLPTPPTTGIARPLRIGGEAQQVVLSIGVQDGEPAEITVNISLNRATGHDFSNIGTGGFNTSNYPNIIFGQPAESKAEAYTNEDIAEKSQVWEKGKGRVFVMSTDEDGFFRVGKFFEVDQGTGTVKFAAQINISGLDGLGFRDGETINKFTGDSGMSPIDNSTVPTSYSVEQYIDRRLGFDRNMNVKTALLGDGFLPQKNPILTQTLDVNQNPDHTLNMTGGRIVQLADPTQDLDATNKQYVDKRVFANDEIQELRDIELNEVNFEADYGKNDLLVLTGNRRVYVKQNTGNPDDWRIGDLITGVNTTTAAYIEDLEAKTLDNGEEVWILTYKPLEITSITTSGNDNNLASQRGWKVQQVRSGAVIAEGEIIWAQSSTSTNDSNTKTQGNEIQVINVTGTFTFGDSNDTLVIRNALDADVTSTAGIYPLNILIRNVNDFENEKIENTNGAYGDTTGGFDGAPVTTTLEFANASEANSTADDGDPGTTGRSDVNISVERVRGTQNAITGEITDPGKTKVNLQLQEQSIINVDVNNEADIIQSKLLMNNAPVLTNSDALDDASTAGQRTKQANQGLAAFSSDSFAEDQLWTLTGTDAQAFVNALSINDIVTQGGTKTAYVDSIVSANNPYQIRVRTADAFATGNAANNRLSRIEVTESDYTKEASVASLTTIDNVLHTGFINIKDRGIGFDKLREIPEKTVIGRSDIDYDGNDEGSGESGITRAIPFSLIVDEGGALQDKDFANSNINLVSGAIITTTGELTIPNGTVITQVGNLSATGTVQGDVNTENKIVLVSVSGTFNTSGELQPQGGASYGADSVPTGVVTSQNLLGSALVKIQDGIYGTTPITTAGGDDSLVRTIKTGDTYSSIDNTMDLGGWIDVKGLIVDGRRAIDFNATSSKLELWTPGDNLSMTLEGSDPPTGQSVKHNVRIPTSSVQIGSTAIEKSEVDYAGFASNFMQNSGLTKDEPYLVTPWVFTNYIQAPGDLDNTGTGISIGAGGRHTGADEIALVVNGDGTNTMKITYDQIDMGVAGGVKQTITDGTTTIKNSLNINNGANTKFSVANTNGNTRVYGTFQADGNTTIGIDDTNTLTLNADVASHIEPSADDTYDLGATNNAWRDLYLHESVVFEGAATGESSIIIPAGQADALSITDGTNDYIIFDTQADVDGSPVRKVTIVPDLEFSGTLSVSGAVSYSDDTNSTSTITGSIVTAGGVGIAKDVHIGGSLDVTDEVSIADTTTSTSTSTGALTVAGGVGIGENLYVAGNLNVAGTIDLGDDVAVDTMNIEAVVVQNDLTLRRESDAATGFTLVIEHDSDVVNNADTDKHGIISFRGTNAVEEDGHIRTEIAAQATNSANGSERSKLIFSTAQGAEAVSTRLTVGDEIVASADIVPNGTETIGQSDDTWDAAYIDDVYGNIHGNVKDAVDSAGTGPYNVIAIGTDNPQYTTGGRTPNSANFSTFYGKVVGPIDGNAETASVADQVKLSRQNTVTNADEFLVFGLDNNTFAGRTGESLYTDAGITYNPSTNYLKVSGGIGISGNSTFGSNTVTAGKFIGDVASADGTVVLDVDTTNNRAELTGVVSSLINHNTDSLSEAPGATNQWFTTTRARAAFSAGTGISISSGSISINSSEVTASSTEAVEINGNTHGTNRSNSSTWHYPVFAGNNSASEDLYIDNDGGNELRYQPSTGKVQATTFDGNATTANFADLAEKYLADKSYEPGTVLVFGGENEVTVTDAKGDRKIAGVVSTDPGFLMNKGLEGDTVVELALTGRVPCKVIGKVEKGDMLVTSAIPGYAIVDNDPKLGTVIGKAVGTKDDDGRGVVEVVVGRL